MSAAILFVVVGLAIYFGFLVGQGRAYAVCETRDTEALRLAAAARAEEQRQFRAAVLSEALGVIGESCRKRPSFTIDLRDPPTVDGEA